MLLLRIKVKAGINSKARPQPGQAGAFHNKLHSRSSPWSTALVCCPCKKVPLWSEASYLTAMASRPKIELRQEERSRLEKLVTAPRTLNRYVWRARIVLLSAEGVGSIVIARRVGKSKRTV